MAQEERLRDMRALCECMKYLLEDAVQADLSLVALHLKIAIAEIEANINDLQAGSDNDSRRRKFA